MNKYCNCSKHLCENCKKNELAPLEKCPDCHSIAFHLKEEDNKKND